MQSLNEIMKSIRREDMTYIDQDGYITVVYNGRTILYHRFICERALGKPLPPNSVVHHVNGNKRYNAHRNLVVCQDEEYHQLLHKRTRELGIKFPKPLDLIEYEQQIKLRRYLQTFPAFVNKFAKHIAESSFTDRFGREVIVRGRTVIKLKKKKDWRGNDWIPSNKDIDWSGPW